LGVVLLELGKRERGTEHLEQARNALQKVLEESTRERVSLERAQAQNNLGHALSKLGEREGTLESLRQAEAALQSA
jgi:tetratricopeptide (TPR) repeat protein